MKEPTAGRAAGPAPDCSRCLSVAQSQRDVIHEACVVALYQPFGFGGYRAERNARAAQALGAAVPGQLGLSRALARLVAQLALARGDVAGATLALAEPGAVDDSRAGLMLRAELALAEGSVGALRHSGQALQTWVAEHRGDATAWQLLAQTTERQGLRLRSLRADAESQAALGNLPGAIDRLRAGQQAARSGGSGTDFIEASVIDARLRDLLAQRRALVADQRRIGPQREPQE